MQLTTKYPRLLTLAASVIVIAALYLARSVLIPFVLAMLVSFLLAPLVLRLQRWKFRRVPAVLTAVLLVFVAGSVTSWVFVGQVRELTTRLAEYKQNIHEKMAALHDLVGRPVQAALESVNDLGTDLSPASEPQPAGASIQTVRIATPVRGPFEILRDMLGPTVDILMTAAMALLFAFVMLLRRDDLGDRLINLMGQGQILVTTRGIEEAARKVSSYLWRFLVLNCVHGLAVGIGLVCIGVPNAILWGLLAAILRFIPYVGPWIAATFPVLTALAVFPGWLQPLLTIGLFATLELVSNNLLEPWLYGMGTGLSSLAVLASALFWTWLWGPVGLVLSTPLTVCLVVMGKHVPQLAFLQQLFGDAPGLSPPDRLYQRLIAGDSDQAWLVLRGELEHKSLQEAYDEILLPALSMAEHDRQRAALSDADMTRIDETLNLLLAEAGDLRIDSAAGPDSGTPRAPTDSLRVLCLPARADADAVAAQMLRQVLERDGIEVEVASTSELAGETLELLASRHVDIVCISAVPPSRFMHVSYLCKRIAARYPRMPIVAGVWTQEEVSGELAQRLATLAGVHVVTSLGAARSQVRQLTPAARIEHETCSDVDASAATPG